MARTRFTLVPSVPEPPAEVEERIVAHLGRRTHVKPVQYGIEIASIQFAAFRGLDEVRRWLTERLDEVEPKWRTYYSLRPRRLSPEAVRWLSETSVAAARALLSAKDPALSDEERREAEQLVAVARADADRLGLLPSLSRNLATKSLAGLAKCDVDGQGWLVLPDRGQGRRLRSPGEITP